MHKPPSVSTICDDRHETVARVVNGTYNMQKRWIEEHSLGWDRGKAQSSAQKMYDKIFHMKVGTRRREAEP